MVGKTEPGSSSRVTSEGGNGEAFKRLSVSDFKKKKRRTLEKNFEKTFYKALEACGYPNEHMAMREPGWPDRYAKGGVWIELKSLDTLGTDNGTSKDQKRILSMLDRWGDHVFYCAKFEDSFILKPWSEIRGRNLKDVERYHYRRREDIEHAIRHEIAGRDAARRE
jgi:hypothetical protein